MINTLFVFIDESGNFDFTEKGTRHYVLSAITTVDPIKSATALQRLRYKHLSENIDLEYFHASEDKQFVRNEVMNSICSLHDVLRTYNISVDKNDLESELRNSISLYSKMGVKLIDRILADHSSYGKIIFVLDKCLPKKDQEMFLKILRPKMKDSGISYLIHFNRTIADPNGQIADYFSWAKYVSLERREMRPLGALRDIERVDLSL